MESEGGHCTLNDVYATQFVGQGLFRMVTWDIDVSKTCEVMTYVDTLNDFEVQIFSLIPLDPSIGSSSL